MTPYVGCESARDLLPGFLDGELGVEEQVALESHLRWCRTCTAHVDDLRTIGDCLRLAAGPSAESDDELSGLQMAVLSRVHIEREQLLTTRVRAFFDDMHFAWAGLGATAGAILCVLLSIGVLSADSRPDSLAGMIDHIAVQSQTGSDTNPMKLDLQVLPPRLFIPEAPPGAPPRYPIPDNDAVFALAATVTREGRVADYEVLQSDYSSAETPASAADTLLTDDDATLVQTAVLRSRFLPARARSGPVAVNMVWVLARTTVKGAARPPDFDDLIRRHLAARPRGTS